MGKAAKKRNTLVLRGTATPETDFFNTLGAIMDRHELKERYKAIGRKHRQVLVDLTRTNDDEYLTIEALIQGVFEDSTKSIQPDLEQLLIDLTAIDSPE